MKTVDPRIGLILTNDNSYTCCMTGKKFSFKTPADKIQAAQAYIAHTDAVIARRERYAQTRLTSDQLLHGISHSDPRTSAQRVKFDSGWRMTPTPIESTETMSPMDNPRFHGTQNPETKKQFYARVDAAYRKRVGAPPAEDPLRAKAREVAAAKYEKALFSPECTVQQVAESKRLVQQAEGCLTAFAEQVAAYQQVEDATEAGRKADLSARMAALETERLPRFDTEPEPEPLDKSPRVVATFATDAEYEAYQRAREQEGQQ